VSKKDDREAMTKESHNDRNNIELKYFLATPALPVALVGFPVALLLGAMFGEKIHKQDQSMMPFVVKCGLAMIGLSTIVAGIAFVLSRSLG
jgi:hypothetical protein